MRWLVGWCLIFWWACTAQAGQLDVPIVCNGGFTHEAGFQSEELCLPQATAVRDYLLTREPYKSRAADIRWHLIWAKTSLGCKLSGRLWTCNGATARAVVEGRGIPVERGIIIVNSTTYGGSGGTPFAVVYKGTYRNKMALHEFGHTLGGLVDEYRKWDRLIIHQDAWYGQCWKGVNPPPGSPGEWVQGGENPNIWRQRIWDVATQSWKDSTMRALAYPVYGPKSVDLLNARITYWASVP